MLDEHPIPVQGGVAIFIVASCYRTGLSSGRVGCLWLVCDFTVSYNYKSFLNYFLFITDAIRLWLNYPTPEFVATVFKFRKRKKYPPPSVSINRPFYAAVEWKRAKKRTNMQTRTYSHCFAVVVAFTWNRSPCEQDHISCAAAVTPFEILCDTRHEKYHAALRNLYFHWPCKT